MLDNESFANYLGVDYIKKGNLVLINCPYHPDSHPSLVIYPEHDRAVHCFPCGTTVSWEYLAMEIKGITYRQALEDLGRGDLQPSATHNVVKAPSVLTFCDPPKDAFCQAYAERFAKCSDEYPEPLVKWLNDKKLLDPAKKLGWKWHVEGVFKRWKDGLVIPYYFGKKIAYARFRGLQVDNGKFDKPKGPINVGVQPYFSTFRPNDTVFIVEGESDAASVWAHGMSAIGIPGACSRKAINTVVAFIADHPYIKRIVACGDNDNAGQKMNALIREAMVEFSVKAELIVYSVESDKEKADLNDDHVAGLFKPPIQWGMNYGLNYDRNFPKSGFGDYTTVLSKFLKQCEDQGVNPWEKAGNIEVLPRDWQSCII